MAESLRDLVVSLSLNTDNFTRNIQSVNKQIHEAESYFKLASAGVKDFDTSANGLSSKLDMLQRKLSLQKDAVGQYEKALSAASVKLTECYTRQQDYANRLVEAKLKQRDMADALANATAQYERLRDALGETDSATIMARDNMEAAQQEYNAATAEVQRLAGQQDALKRSTQNAADAVSTAQTQLNKAKAAIKETEAAIRDTNQQLRTAQSSWTAAGKALTEFGNRCQKVGQSAVQVGRTLSRTITTPIVGLATASVKASLDFESSFASVRKTVEATEEEFDRLAEISKEMSTQVAASTSEINEVMATGGQLGVATENLQAFTKVMIDLGNSCEDLNADEAATSIAKFANVMKTDQSLFSNIGSTIVDLGNNFATTEKPIMEMAQRLAGAGKQVGLTEAQVLGFAAALSSVGIEAQMGGSAFSKALVKMEVASATGGQALEDFAKVCGMTGQQFKVLWDSDPAAAFEAFIVGLSRMDDEGESAIATLNEIGISEVRLRDTLLRATNATELFASAQARANKAWEENSALTVEANKRYATTASQLTNLKNKAVLFAQQIGNDLNPTIRKLIDGASDLLDKFMGMDTAQRQQIIKWAAIVAAIGPAVLAFGKVSKGIGVVVKSLGTFATAVGSAGGGISGFLSVLGKCPSVWAAVAVAVVAGSIALTDYMFKISQTKKAMEDMASVAENWKNTAAETFYGQSEGLSAFGMSKEDFSRATTNAQSWMNGLIAVWTDGEKETDEIVKKWTEAWKGLTGSTKEELEELKTAAEEAGYGSVADQISDAIEQLDSMDKEIETLLKKRQNGFLTDNEKLRLQELIDTREEIIIKYDLEPAGTDGFTAIEKKVEAAVARAKAMGREDTYLSVYQDAMVAAAEGMAQINAELDEQYDKEYKLIGLMTDEDEQVVKLDELNTRYTEDRRAAAMEYAETLQKVAAPVFNQDSIKDTADQMAELNELLTKYSMATGDERQGMLPELAKFAESMDEGSLTEYLGLLTQIQSLLDEGLTEDEINAMFPDVSTPLDQYAAIVEALKLYRGELPDLYSMFGEAAPEEVVKIATDLDMTGAQARWNEFASNPGAILTDAVVQSYTAAANATAQQPHVDAFIDKYTEVEDGASTASLTPTGLVAYVTAYAEATTGTDVSGLTPTNITAMVAAYKELATGTDVSALTPSEITAYISKYLEKEGVDTTGLSPSAITAFVMAYAEITGGASKAGLTPSDILAYVSKYAEATTGTDVSGLTPTNITAMVAAYKELATGTDVSALTPSEITAYISKYLEKEGVDTSGITPSAITAFVSAYQEIEDGASTGGLTPSGILAYVSKYAESTGVDVSGLTPSNIKAMVSAYQELATGTDVSALTPNDITAYISKYLEKEGVDTSGITPSAITAFVSAYQEIEDGAATSALTPTGIAAMVAKYLEAEGVDVSALSPDQVNAIVSAYSEATGCDKSKLLTAFTAYISSYDDTGATVPKPKTRVTVTGYDLKAYRAFAAANPDLAVEIPTRLSQISATDWAAYVENGKVNVWKDGVPVTVTPEVLEKLPPDALVIVDPEDKTVHVLVTPEFTGSPEAIEDVAEELEETFATSDAASALVTAVTGDTTLNLNYFNRVGEALKRINEYYKGGLFSPNIQNLTRSMNMDFNPDAAANLGIYVGELATALKNGEDISEEDLNRLLEIYALLSELNTLEANNEDAAGIGSDIREGIANGLTEAGWDTDAESVAKTMEEAFKSAFQIHSPSIRMQPIGSDAAAGIGEGMKLYDPTTDAAATATAVQSAMEGKLTRLSLVGVGLNAMAGLAAGIRSGQFSVVEAMRTAAQAAVRAAKDELDINSPSRVFRDEVGAMVMKGFGEGVEKEAAHQARILSNAARFLTGEAKESAIAYNTNDNRKTYQATSNVNVTGNTFQVRDETDIRSLAIEIAALTKRQQHGQGLRFA